MGPKHDAVKLGSRSPQISKLRQSTARYQVRQIATLSLDTTQNIQIKIKTPRSFADNLKLIWVLEKKANRNEML